MHPTAGAEVRLPGGVRRVEDPLMIEARHTGFQVMVRQHQLRVGQARLARYGQLVGIMREPRSSDFLHGLGDVRIF